MSHLSILYLILSDHYVDDGDPFQNEGNPFQDEDYGIFAFTIVLVFAVLDVIGNYREYLKANACYSVFDCKEKSYLKFLIENTKSLISAPKFINLYLKLRLIHVIWFLLIWFEFELKESLTTIECIGMTSTASIWYICLQFILYLSYLTYKFKKQKLN